ncbi:aldo/keto reductase [Nocardia altamirensis]|uniref:aldo/keto reductase n=1 Tax=Nocardia altamirensis TaxID=472158 RepID=UPI0008404245|nr:aldo/keto reductase [Nocardia altamirensis]
MTTRKLGQLEVSAQGLGCSRMGGLARAEFAEVIHRAIDLGVTLFDTADSYGPYINEQLLGQAIAGHRDQLTISTKFGIYYENGYLRARGDTNHVRDSCDGSLQRLGVDHIDLYDLHRVDPDVPIEETWGAMSELVTAGKVRYLSISEVSATTLRRAHAIHPVTALQSEWSLWWRDLEAEIIPTCRQLSIGIVPFAPLGRGLLTGTIASADTLPDDDLRRSLPRFSAKNLQRNLTIVDALRALAAEKSITVGQLALAWVQHRGVDVVPIPGTKSRNHLEENIASVDIDLSAAEIEKIEAVSPSDAVAGARFPDRLVRYVGS